MGTSKRATAPPRPQPREARGESAGQMAWNRQTGWWILTFVAEMYSGIHSTSIACRLLQLLPLLCEVWTSSTGGPAAWRLWCGLWPAPCSAERMPEGLVTSAVGTQSAGARRKEAGNRINYGQKDLGPQEGALTCYRLNGVPPKIPV